MKIFWVLNIIILAGIISADFVSAAQPLSVIINEIAWMGTENNSSDEWIELYNNTEQAISFENWGLYEAKGEILIEPLTGIIEPKSYYLIERTDDTTISDILASQKPSSWGGYGLKNTGEHLQLLDQNSVIIDEIICSAGWFGGDNKTKQTMERKNPQLIGNNPENWQTSVESGGTPKSQNSNPVEESVEVKPQQQPEPKKVGGDPFSSKLEENGSPLNSPTNENLAVDVRHQQPPQQLNQLAAISKNLSSLKIFLIAFALAVFSGTSVLLLKKKTKNGLI
jgi:hypothetical protein